MLRRSSKYRDVELNALITSAWLSPGRFFYNLFHSRIKEQIGYKRSTICTHLNTNNLSEVSISKTDQTFVFKYRLKSEFQEQTGKIIFITD